MELLHKIYNIAMKCQQVNQAEEQPPKIKNL